MFHGIDNPVSVSQQLGDNNNKGKYLVYKHERCEYFYGKNNEKDDYFRTYR